MDPQYGQENDSLLVHRHGGERLVRLHRAGHHLHRALRHRVCLQAQRRPALRHHATDACQSYREHDMIFIRVCIYMLSYLPIAPQWQMCDYFFLFTILVSFLTK